MTNAECEQQQRRVRPSLDLRRLSFAQVLNQSQNSIKLDRDAVHLWHAFPDDWSDEELQHCHQQILTPDEQEKCRRFVFEKDRRICAVACVLIRGALSNYCETPPCAWLFSTNNYG